MVKPKKRPPRAIATGIGSDPQGGPLIDPTENVKALMAASLESLSTVREADIKYNDAVTGHLKEMADLRAAHAAQLRQSDLNAGEKTRQVDVLAAAGSAASLATAVSALQAASDRNTETLRNQVADTAQAMAKQTSESAAAVQLQTENLFRRTETSIAAVADRVGALERTGATSTGRQSVADPQLAEFVSKLDKLVSLQAAGSGKQEGSSDAWKWLLAGIATLGTLVGIAGTAVAVVLFIAK